MSSSKFSDEFKRDAVAQITERSYPVREVSERSGSARLRSTPRRRSLRRHHPARRRGTRKSDVLRRGWRGSTPADSRGRRASIGELLNLVERNSPLELLEQVLGILEQKPEVFRTGLPKRAGETASSWVRVFPLSNVVSTMIRTSMAILTCPNRVVRFQS